MKDNLYLGNKVEYEGNKVGLDQDDGVQILLTKLT